MAQMVPPIPLEETASKAERALFSVFQSGLDDTFVVYHSLGLLPRNLGGTFVEGEIDFLVFSPATGILIIEVKGGKLTFDPATRAWYQNGLAIKDPFRQA